MRSFCGFTCIAALLCTVIAVGAAARTDMQARRAVLRVTLNATVTKKWNTVAETTLGGCDVAIHAVGTRKIVLRSLRPTSVVVTATGGRVSYSPTAIRFVRVDVSGTGNDSTKYEAPCMEHTVRNDCPRSLRVLTGGTFRFFRSKRNEISFRPTRLPEVPGTCPWQSAQLRAIEPGLQQAQGELAEAALTNLRAPGQTALASADIESDFDGDEVGRVTERVRWSLTFRR